MADTPISGLPAASSVTASDLVPLVHSGTTYAATPSQIVGSVRREASVTGVHADDTQTVITFAPAFASTVGPIRFGLENYSGTDDAVLSSPLIINGTKTVSGFTVVIRGGVSGSTVTLHYEASGT